MCYSSSSTSVGVCVKYSSICCHWYYFLSDHQSKCREMHIYLFIYLTVFKLLWMDGGGGRSSEHVGSWLRPCCQLQVQKFSPSLLLMLIQKYLWVCVSLLINLNMWKILTTAGSQRRKSRTNADWFMYFIAVCYTSDTAVSGSIWSIGNNWR